MPTIYVSEEVFAELQKRAKPLVDNPDSVLRRVFGLDHPAATPTALEIVLPEYALRYSLIPVAKANRQFFPGIRVPFLLETEVGTFTVKVSSGYKDTPDGAMAGDYITGGLKKLYDASRVKPGDTLRIEALEPGKRYKVSIVRK